MSVSGNKSRKVVYGVLGLLVGYTLSWVVFRLSLGEFGEAGNEQPVVPGFIILSSATLGCLLGVGQFHR